MISEHDRNLLEQWNRTETGYPSDLCTHQLFEAQAKRSPEAVAAIFGSRQWTYRELNERANQLAHHLRKLGVGPDVPVGICARRCAELPVFFLGVLKAGGACLPLDPAYPSERLAYMQGDAQAPVLILGRGVEGDFTGFAKAVLLAGELWHAISGESEQNLDDVVGPEDLAYIVYTSGSTGKPRGVLLPHRGLVNHHLSVVDLYELTAKDRILQFGSISFDISIEEMYPIWSVGGTVVFASDNFSLQPSHFVSWMAEHGITVLSSATAYWHELVQELADRELPLPASLRLIAVGGEKASINVFASWQQLAKGRVRWMNTYGPSEASVIVTAYEPPADASLDLDADIPIGRPIPNIRAYILDTNLQPVPVGEIGEVHIGGVGLARGYLNRPELTDQKFIPDPFSAQPGARMYKTGDLARFLPDGNIEFRGRTDDQVKIRGFRIEPGEIEATLSQHPDVHQAIVLAREDRPGEKRLVAYIVPKQARPVTNRQMREFLKGRLPEYLIPSGFVAMESLPLTPNGKVDKRALPSPSADSIADTENYVAPRNEVEIRITKIWEATLGIPRIGIADDFFELGGHSLLALRMMRRLEQAFGKNLPPSILFQAPTVEKLAAVLREDAGAQNWRSLVAIQPRGSKTPFFCVHGLGGHVLRFGALAQHLSEDRPFYGLQAHGLDGEHPCHTRVEDMAAHYISEIRSLQPQGPYFIGGYSFGGAVAFEMARQLRQHGEDVAFLALLDTYQRSARKGQSLARTFLQMSTRDKVAYALSKRRTISKRILSRFAALWFPRALKRVHAACDLADKAYQWPSANGPVWWFRASEKGLRGRETPPMPQSSPAGKWHIHEIPADHGSLIREPQVRNLAEVMRSCMETALDARRRETIEPEIAKSAPLSFV
jgi:amino acid adenylation domain-containing protein